MSCGKCGNGGKAKKICPVSFGLAVGIVSFFAIFIWTLWVMRYGMPPMMITMHLPAPTIQGGLVHALLAFVKGFLFGFFVALLYDFFACCCFARCKKDEKCECNGPLEQKK